MKLVLRQIEAAFPAKNLDSCNLPPLVHAHISAIETDESDLAGSVTRAVVRPFCHSTPLL